MTLKANSPLLAIGAFLLALAPAQAELIDNSAVRTSTISAAQEQAQTFEAKDVAWKFVPRLNVPAHLKQKEAQGKKLHLNVNLLVDKQGNVVNATVVKSSGDKALDAAMIQTFKNSKLNPFMVDGKPVVGTVTIPIDYGI